MQEQRTYGRVAVIYVDEIADYVDLSRLEALTADGLFVWWPQLWGLLHEAERYRVLQAFVEADRLPCRRDELDASDWDRIATCLPGARELAGSFLPESGGNCLGTVMAAFGAPAVAERWVHPEPFERWLGRFSRLSEHSAQASPKSADLGLVLVWRD